jgi:hypothetical protein
MHAHAYYMAHAPCYSKIQNKTTATETEIETGRWKRKREMRGKGTRHLNNQPMTINKNKYAKLKQKTLRSEKSLGSWVVGA